jgi:hypothetical protein
MGNDPLSEDAGSYMSSTRRRRNPESQLARQSPVELPRGVFCETFAKFLLHLAHENQEFPGIGNFLAFGRRWTFWALPTAILNCILSTP